MNIKVTVIEIKHYQLRNIIIKLDFFLNYIINDLQKSDLWKIQLTIAINFVSSKENGEDLVMHSKSDNIEFMIYDNTDEVTEELLESLHKRYQIR